MMEQWWPMPWFPVFFLVVCLIVFLFVMAPTMRRRGPWRDRGGRFSFPQKTALEILNERFGRGEIDKAEYEEKKRLIS